MCAVRKASPKTIDATRADDAQLGIIKSNRIDSDVSRDSYARRRDR
jgi:hypothetical protein